MREIKYYPPTKRRQVENNLQCLGCGNTHAFFIDLRLRHQVNALPQGCLSVALDERVRKTLANLEKNIAGIVNKGQDLEMPYIRCANCRDGSIFLQEELIENCWQTGCPGCSTCGMYISKQEMIDFCTHCIIERDGNIEEDDCCTFCPYFEHGLGEVRDHYDVSLSELKNELGFPA